MKRLYVALLGTALVGVAAAHAADLPVAAPAPPPVYKPHRYSWTGVYFGGSIGAGYRPETYTEVTPFSDLVTPTASLVLPAGSQSSHAPFGLVGGGQIGATYQMGVAVVGVEAMWLQSTVTGYGLQTAGANGIGVTQVKDMDTSRWYAMATARAGIADDNLLYYVKGGAAWTRINYERDVIGTGVPPLANAFVVGTSSQTDTRVGWTIGGGAEWGVSENLTIRGEYDYLNFGTKNYTDNYLVTLIPAAPPTPATVTGPYSNTVAIKSQTHMFLAGMNYRFTWGGGGF